MDDQRWGFEEADDWEYQELDGQAAILSVQSLTNTISTEQNTIAQKVHDLGTEWAKSNTGAMQGKSDWHVMS